MGENGEKRVREWLNVIFNALMFLVMLTMLVLTVRQVFPFFSEKLEVLVTQQAGHRVEVKHVESVQAADGGERVVLSIPFEVRIINVGKTDVVLRQCRMRILGEENLPNDCAYEFDEEQPQKYFDSLAESTLTSFPIHLASGGEQKLIAWLNVAIIGEPAARLSEALTQVVGEVSCSDLARMVMGTALALCNVGMKVLATVATGERQSFSSPVVEWNRPFVSCLVSHSRTRQVGDSGRSTRSAGQHATVHEKS